jgi:hypothetical protein
MWVNKRSFVVTAVSAVSAVRKIGDFLVGFLGELEAIFKNPCIRGLGGVVDL